MKSILRNCRLALVALSGLLFIGTAGVVMAQPLGVQAPEGGGGGGGRGGGRGGMSIEQLTDRLKLTPDQQEKIKPILADQQKQMQALMQDQSASQDDRRAKMMALRTSTNDKINAVLTADQKTEFAKMQSEQRGRMGGGGAPPPQQ